MNERIPVPPWMKPDYEEELTSARLAYAVYGSRDEIVASMAGVGPKPFTLPINWSLLGDDEIRRPDNFKENADTGFVAAVFEMEATYQKRLVIAVRGSDDPRDWNAHGGPNLPLAADGELMALAGVPFAPKGETPKRQMAALQQSVLPDWSPAFEDALNYGLEIQRKYETQGYQIEVVGHSMGGSQAQLLSYTFGWGGRTFDAAGAVNIINSDEYQQWCKSRGVVPKGAPAYDPEQPQGIGLLNYAVNDSVVSRMTGPHIGKVVPVTALGGREGFEDYAKYTASKAAGLVSDIPLAGDFIAARSGLRGPWVDMALNAMDKGLDATERHDMERIIRVFEKAADNQREQKHEGHELQQWGQVSPDRPSSRAASPIPAAMHIATAAVARPLPADMRDADHPGHGLYLQAFLRVRLFESQNRIAEGPHSAQLAASIAVLTRREKLELGRTFLEKGEDGRIAVVERARHGEGGRRIGIDAREMSSRSIEHSSNALAALQSPHYVSRSPAVERTPEQMRTLAQLPPGDQAMFAKIRESVPSHVSDDVVAHVALLAKKDGIADAGKIDHVAMAGDKLWVVGTIPGFRAMVDVSSPAPSMQTILQQTQEFNQRQEQTLAMQATQGGQEGPSFGPSL